jgi:hypothetical protein
MKTKSGTKKPRSTERGSRSLSPVLVSAFFFALTLFPVSSFLALAPLPAPSIFTLPLLLVVSLFALLLAPVAITTSPITIPITLSCCRWIRSEKHSKTKEQCQTISNNCWLHALHPFF